MNIMNNNRTMSVNLNIPVVYQYVLEKAAIIFLVFDRQGIIRETNQFSSNLLGPDVIGRSFSQVFIDFEGDLKLDQLATERASSRLLNVSTKGGLPETFYFDFFEENDHIFVLGQSDSNELDLLRRNLLDINTQLSNTTRMLQKANAELNHLNTLKNQFLGMAAHDMRSPIGHIMACSEFLMEKGNDCLKDEEMEFLDIIKSSSEFLLGLINEFLDLSIIESGHLNLDLRPTDLVSLVKHNIRLNGLLAEEKNMVLNMVHFEPIPTLLLDSAKIEQVLNNLISNALKFSEPGSSVNLRLYKTRQDVVVSVQDQGTGISPSELSQIFNPFIQAGTARKKHEKGAGLGLAIARKIITGHRGRMWVESEKGLGSTFYFSIPIQS